MSGTVVSDFMAIRRFALISFQCKWTGNPIGVFTVEASNNENDSNSFTTIKLDADEITTENSENPFLIKIPECPYRAIRLRYTATSGVGILNVYAAGKE
jgi:hypothetical protein